MREHSGTTTRPEPGWYPDYDAAPGWERYWNGEEWTDGRREWVGEGRPRSRGGERGVHVPVWVYVAVAAVVALVAGVLLLTHDSPSDGRQGAHRVDSGTAPPPASTPGPPPSESGTPAGQRRLWDVASVVDGRTLELTNGADVRLIGVAGGCTPGAAADWLTDHVAGAPVALIKDGADKDAEGHLLRYVSLDGSDVGLEMIEAGVATAAGGHTRAEKYAAADAGCR